MVLGAASSAIAQGLCEFMARPRHTVVRIGFRV